MNSIENKLASTISFYDKKAHQLISSYENADMGPLHTLLTSTLTPNSKVMDIGFGSGRELHFLKEKGFDVWGVDPSQEFVNRAKKRFSDIPHHFFNSSLPNLELPKELQHSFDTIILIAVWMHLPKSTYTTSINSLLTFLKPGGKIILSYSITPREEKSDRYFEDIDISLLHTLFVEHGCKRISNNTNTDGLGEREMIWVTEVYKHDKF